MVQPLSGQELSTARKWLNDYTHHNYLPYYPKGTPILRRGLNAHYPGGIDGFKAHFASLTASRPTLLPVAKTMLSMEEEERISYLSGLKERWDNPLNLQYVENLSSDLLWVRDEAGDALECVDGHPESFSETDITRLKSLFDDPSLAEYIQADMEVLAVNNYDALCLSSHQIPFIDVDTRNQVTLKRLLNDLGTMGLGGRLYRTTKGYRVCLFQEMPTEQLFGAFLKKSAWRSYGIDKRYAVVCRQLGTYRARCTAKPWRLSKTHYQPLSRYERYRYPVVQFIENFGCTAPRTPLWGQVMACHDTVSRCLTNPFHTLY